MHELIVVPFKASFLSEIIIELEKYELSFSLFFILDILITFCTAIYIDGTLIEDSGVIAKLYMQNGLLVDIISSFPIEFFILLKNNQLNQLDNVFIF